MKKFILFALLALLLPSSAWSYDVGEIFTANVGTEESPYYMRFKKSTQQRCVIYGEEGNPAIDPESAGQNGDGVLTIPWQVDNLIIEEICSYAFAECLKITSVVIEGRSIPFTIGEYAFFHCTSLQKVISTSVFSNVWLESHAFDGCSNLERYSCSSDRVPSYAFANCSSLKTIETEYNELSYIGECAFYNCSVLDWNFSVEDDGSIGDQAFYNCTSLTQVGNLGSVGDQAFYNCSSLTGQVRARKVGREAFAGTNISSITFYQPSDDYYYDEKMTVSDFAFAYSDSDKGEEGDYSDYYDEFDENEGSLLALSIHLDESVSDFSFSRNAFSGRDITSISVDESNPNFDSRNNCNAIISHQPYQWYRYNEYDYDDYDEFYYEGLILGCKNTIIPTDEDVKVINPFAFCGHVDKIYVPENIKRLSTHSFLDCEYLQIDGCPAVEIEEGEKFTEIKPYLGWVELPIQLYGIYTYPNMFQGYQRTPYLKLDNSYEAIYFQNYSYEDYYGYYGYYFELPSSVKGYIPVKYTNGIVKLKSVDVIRGNSGILLVDENPGTKYYLDFAPKKDNDDDNLLREAEYGFYYNDEEYEENPSKEWYVYEDDWWEEKPYILTGYEDEVFQFTKVKGKAIVKPYEAYLSVADSISIIFGSQLSVTNLTIDVTDENTYSSDEAPHVKNATVVIYEKDSMNEIRKGKTGNDGTLLVENIPTGDYIIHVEAENHRSRDYEFHRNGDEDEYVEIFISLNKYLTVDVTDEFTYYTEEKPHVENATVIVYEKDSMKEIQRGITGKDGTVSFENLPIGDYIIHVEADEHESKDYDYHRAADEDETIEITISYTGGVTCEFIVEETSVPDLYNLSVNYTLAVDIPIPFVSLSVPKSIPVDDMAVGQSFEFQATLYNNGLIKVNDVALLLPDDIPFMSFVPQQAYQGLSIKAKESVTITVKATKTAAGDCKKAKWGAAWSYPVGESTVPKNHHDILMSMGTCPMNLNEINAIVQSNDYIGSQSTVSYQAIDGEKIENVSTDKPYITVSVDVEIGQALSLTRQAFRGTMTMKNTFPASLGSIKDILFNLDIIDTETGEKVTDKEFEVQLEKLSGFEGEQAMNGPWSLASGKQGEVSVLMIPTKYAAPTKPKTYKLLPSISYIDPLLSMANPDEGRKEENLIPKNITVNPTPQLVLDYFIPKKIVGDDPMTEDVVEASEPAELGLLIRNEGYGEAKNLKITTKQPEIVDNRDSLLIDFAITGGTVNGKDVQMTEGKELVSDFGTLKARSTAYAQWWLTSTLLGRITKYDVSYFHETDYENENFSLLSAVNAHTLIRSIKQDDLLFGFLTDKQEARVFQFYGADGSKENVQSADDIDVTKKTHFSYVVRFVVPDSGYIYGYIQDPTDGEGKLKGDNLIDYWRENVRFSDEAPARWMKAPAIHEKNIHFICRVPEANKAYELTLDMDAPDQVNSVVTTSEKDEWYTLSGLRVSKPNAKGVYIHNGRKVLVR
jgi:hypothetical protein